MTIIKLGGLLFALAIVGCVDDLEPLPPDEVTVDEEIDPSLATEDPEGNPQPADDTCGARQKADGACVP